MKCNNLSNRLQKSDIFTILSMLFLTLCMYHIYSVFPDKK